MTFCHMKKKSRWMLLLAVVVFLAACSGSPGAQEEEAGGDSVNLGEPVAMVNGEAIYEDYFQRVTERMIWSYQQQGMDFEGDEGAELRLQVEESVLDHLIQQAVMIQEAENLGLAVGDEEVESELEGLKGQFETEEEFQDILERTRFTEQELKETLRTEMTIEALLEKAVAEVQVAEEELMEHYAAHEAQHEIQMDLMKKSDEELSDEELAMMQLPPYEEMKEQLRSRIIQEKQQEVMRAFVDELMEKSDIEILI